MAETFIPLVIYTNHFSKFILRRETELDYNIINIVVILLFINYNYPVTTSFVGLSSMNPISHNIVL